MTSLVIYPDNQPSQGVRYIGFETIKNRLQHIGVELERWTAEMPLTADAGQDAVLAAYSDSVEKLKQRYGFQSVDVAALTPDHPDKAALRQKFLAEHIHEDFEVRFFVAGNGLFYLHADSQVFALLCEQGDLISVPANVRHWFDMGENPDFKCIRLFTAPDGWVAEFTGSTIANMFPCYEDFMAELA